MSQEDAVRFIQELQSTVSSLSKEEALLALGAAKKKIDALTDPKPGKKESTKNTSNQGKKNREKSNTSSVAPLRSSPKVDEVALLLEQAKLAREKMDDAKNNLEKQRVSREKAQKELLEVEASRERLSRVVDASWKEVAEGAATPSPDPLTSPPPATAPSNSPPSSASMPTMAPTLAALSIDLEKSDLCANGALYMNIVLEGEKDDSDRVCIIDANLVERLDLAKLPSLLPSSIAIETFEYIDPSSASSLQLRLPNYAGIFVCFLLRSHQDRVGAVILAKSSIFSILFPLQFSSPTKLYGSTASEGIRSTFPLVTRRGASPLLDNISFLPVSILVENMSNIGTISINGTLKENKTQRTTTLNRLRVWWSRDVLYIEFDVYDVINSSSSCIFFKLDLVNSHTFSFLSSSSFASINDTQTSFSVRLVYDRSLSPYMPITSSVEKAASCLPAGLICGFCGHIVVEESKLTEVRDLPSGTFDHMMHDFICGECFSSSSSPTANPLTTNDIHVSPTHLYVGSTSVLISGRAVLASSVRLSCKALPSVLDCVYGLSAIHIGCCPPSPSSSSSSLISSAALIDVNTCKIHCSRCQSYLGDGTISSSDKAEGKEDVQSQAFTEKTMQPPSFDLDDIATVRLPLHAIAIRSSSNESLSFILSLSTEQMLARCILHVSRSNSCSRFALLPASSISSSPAGYNVMHLTLLNSSYQQFYAAFEEGLNETSSQHICLRDALKVECCLSGALHNSEKQRNIRKGRILPIHLPLCNFREIVSVLTLRSKAYEFVIKSNGIEDNNSFMGKADSMLENMPFTACLWL